MDMTNEIQLHTPRNRGLDGVEGTEMLGSMAAVTAALKRNPPKQRSIAWLAEQLGVTRGAVAHWDKVPENRLIEVATILGVAPRTLRPDLAQLFNRKEAVTAGIESSSIPAVVPKAEPAPVEPAAVAPAVAPGVMIIRIIDTAGGTHEIPAVSVTIEAGRSTRIAGKL